MVSKLIIDSNTLRILQYIEQDWEKASKAENDAKSLGCERLLELAHSYQRNAEQCLEDPHQQAQELLKAATLYHYADQDRLAAQCLYRYGQALADHLHLMGNHELMLTYLAEAIVLMNDYILVVPKERVSDIVKELEECLMEYLHKVSVLVSLEELVSRHTEIREMLSISQSFLHPGLAVSLDQTQRVLDTIIRFANAQSGGDKVKLGNQAVANLTEIRRGIHSQCRGKEAKLLRQLVSGWERVVQAELFRVLETVTVPAQPGLQEATREVVQDLIRRVEKRLRALIERKYQQQFGKSWLQHIEAKHPKMYAYWLRNLQKDKVAFQLYTDYSAAILDYSRLEDLAELVNAQWALFRDVFDFGYDKRNKSVFTEKIRDIVRVRNPLAHHRPVPENELLRAQVYCNDILLVIERAKQREDTQSQL